MIVVAWLEDRGDFEIIPGEYVNEISHYRPKVRAIDRPRACVWTHTETDDDLAGAQAYIEKQRNTEGIKRAEAYRLPATDDALQIARKRISE